MSITANNDLHKRMWRLAFINALKLHNDGSIEDSNATLGALVRTTMRVLHHNPWLAHTVVEDPPAEHTNLFNLRAPCPYCGACEPMQPGDYYYREP